MAVPVVASFTTAIDDGASPANTITLAKPSGVSSGDVLYIVAAHDSSLGTTVYNTPSGWTLENEIHGAAAGCTVYLFSRRADGTEPATVDLVMNAQRFMNAVYLRVTGVDPVVAGLAPKYAEADNASSASQTSPSVTTTEPDSIVLSAFVTDNVNADTMTPSGGATEITELQNPGLNGMVLGVYSSSQPTAGTASHSVTLNAAASALAITWSIPSGVTVTAPKLRTVRSGLRWARPSIAAGAMRYLPLAAAIEPDISDAPARNQTITGVSGLTAQNDTRYIDCPGLSIPNNVQRITVIGSQMPTTQLRGVRDVWIEGRPTALMNAGPRSDGNDLLQIKRFPLDSEATAISPDDITLRWIRFHDVSRPAGSGAHPDGIQVMAGRRGRIISCRFESVDIQPMFLNHSGSLAAGGGEITDWLIEDCYVEQPPNGFFTIIFGGGDSSNWPSTNERVTKRCTARNCRVGSNIRIAPNAFDQGCIAEGTMNLDGSPRNPPYVIA